MCQTVAASDRLGGNLRPVPGILAIGTGAGAHEPGELRWLFAA